MMRSQIKKLLALFTLLAIFISACSDSDPADNPTLVEGEQSIAEITDYNEAYDQLYSALETTGLLSTFEGDGPFTLFAPTDAAFAKLPEGTLEGLTTEQLSRILQYHVVQGAVPSSQLSSSQDVSTLLGEDLLVESGNGVTVNKQASVIAADYMATNGVIHAVDEVLLPSGIREANIVDQADDLGTFTTLVGAVSDVGLATTLMFDGDFTVFAPTDDAFSALPDGLLESLTTEQLTEILTYHVVNSEIPSSALIETQSTSTLAEENLYIVKDGSDVTVNGGGKCSYSRC